MSSSQKNHKNEYQHSMFSISNANFMNIQRFAEARLKKAPGALPTPGPI